MSNYTLYSYFRSSCSARVRIALNIKNQPFSLVPVNLLKHEQTSDAHRALNPSGTVPLLVAHAASDFRITQSLAALEYLEEAHPSAGQPLLPADPRHRAAARSLAAIIAADTQPVTNLRILRRVKKLGADGDQWMRDYMTEGLSAYEAVAAQWAGDYSVGDDLSIADCCLIPAVWNAERYGVDFSAWPTINRVAANLKRHPAVKKESYFRQPDCPEELREKESE